MVPCALNMSSHYCPWGLTNRNYWNHFASMRRQRLSISSRIMRMINHHSFEYILESFLQCCTTIRHMIIHDTTYKKLSQFNPISFGIHRWRSPWACFAAPCFHASIKYRSQTWDCIRASSKPLQQAYLEAPCFQQTFTTSLSYSSMLPVSLDGL